MTVFVQDEGSVVLVHPRDSQARAWLESATDPDAQWFGRALVVEPRYLDDLLEGFREDGGRAE
jgi:hypothetical protein